MKRTASGFVVAAAALLFGSPQPLASQSPLDHRELAADQQVIHALNRLTFGAKPGDATRVRKMGLDKWVDLQFHPERIPDGGIEGFLSRYSVLKADQNELLRKYAGAQRERRMAAERGDTVERRARRNAPGAMQDAATSRRAVISQVQSARVARAVAGNRQLQEVMTDFWLNHFNVFAQKGPPQPYYLIEYERDVIRPNSLGKFRDLLGAVAASPAMLFYLDKARSMGDTSRPRLATVSRRRARALPQEQVGRLRQGGLNENYGRELLELHTLGVDGGYTQQDVIDVARALTGWTIRPPATGGGFAFRPEMHDAGEKTVLGRKLRSGRGIEDGQEVLDIVARHPSTARHIARKLATRFVSDTPPQALVDRAAQVFLRTDGDIREVVRTIVTSNEFYSTAAYRSKVKSPFEVVVSALRGMNAVPDETPRTAQAIALLGQPIYGHQAPNGYPETGEAWMNAGAILNRINFGFAAASNRIPGADVDAIPGLTALGTAPREKQVDAVASLLLNGSISPETRAVLISGENPLLTRADEGTMGRRQNQLSGIAQVVGLALGSPEFQRR